MAFSGVDQHYCHGLELYAESRAPTISTTLNRGSCQTYCSHRGKKKARNLRTAAGIERDELRVIPFAGYRRIPSCFRCRGASFTLFDSTFILLSAFDGVLGGSNIAQQWSANQDMTPSGSGTQSRHPDFSQRGLMR